MHSSSAKIRRNDLCPCGSGQKYKRCCLPGKEAEAAAARRKAEEAASAEAAARPKPPTLAQVIRALAERFVDDEQDGELEHDSNRVVGLIHQGRLDEAEVGARELMTKYPDVTDGLERLGHVYEMRGELTRAIETYREAAQTIETDIPDSEHAQWLRDLADRLEARPRPEQI